MTVTSTETLPATVCANTYVRPKLLVSTILIANSCADGSGADALDGPGRDDDQLLVRLHGHEHPRRLLLDHDIELDHLLPDLTAGYFDCPCTS